MHFNGPNNQYEAAISQVGEVVANYDSDGKFPVFGFGGIPNYIQPVCLSHSFPVNGNASDPEVEGIAGVLRTYKEKLPSIKFSGPTYFGGILEAFKSHCTKC